MTTGGTPYPYVWLLRHRGRIGFWGAVALAILVAWLEQERWLGERLQEAITPEQFAAESDAAFAERDAYRRARPGYEYPREEWEAAARAGQMDWKPGIYRKVPTRSHPGYSADVYVPQAFSGEPMPFVTICMPSPYPGFIKLEPWAEEHGVLLIVMNEVANKTWNDNPKVWAAITQDIFPQLPLDHSRGVCVGLSGGANFNWLMTCREPELHAGLVMMAFPGCEYCDLPQRYKVCWYFHEEEANAPYIRECIDKSREQGVEFRFIEAPGSYHIPSPLPTTELFLNWIYDELAADAEAAARQGV